MRALYIDPFSGISGNMFIGAMVDGGYKIEPFLKGIHPLGFHPEDVIVEKRDKAGISATYFNLIGEEEKLSEVDDDHEHKHSHSHDHHHRDLKAVHDLIDRCDFSEEVKSLAKAIYRPLAEAEAKVHGKDPDTVHFHEVGELDSVVDVLGAAYFTVIADVEAIYVGAVNPGGGTVHCAHGEYPVPAPATAYLLSSLNAPLGGPKADVELTTPTGAAILNGIGANYMARPEGRVLKVSYGAGTRDGAVPNVLRLFFLETEEAAAPVWYSCNLDDMTGEAMGFCMERLFEAGARDVSYTPIFMKKNRPGYRLDVLTDGEKSSAICDVLFSHTTTLGIKKIPIEKIELPRRIEKTETDLGSIRTKFSKWHDMKKASPEYEDLRKIALERALPLETVRREWERR
nr:nickel pincer cofactor biosynthesis protein LarC [uncultured Peptoniphilus sp.]